MRDNNKYSAALYNWEDLRDLLDNPEHRFVTLQYPGIGKCRRYVKSETSEEIVACFCATLKPGYFYNSITDKVEHYQ